MMSLQQIYPGDAIASFIVRVLLEVTLVTLAALLFGRIFSRRNPALRHGACVCALVSVLAAPLTTVALERAGWRTFQIALDHEQGQSSTQLKSASVGKQALSHAVDPFWTVERARSAASLLILVWMFGSGVMLVRLVNGTRKINRLRRSAHSIEDPKLLAVLERLHRVDKLPDVPIRFLRRLHSPFVVGAVHSTVILPEKLLTQLDEEQLRCVLAHELAHVRQRDPLIGLAQRIAEASYWPHPLVHCLNRDLVRAREEVCDNAALHGTTAPQYADTLLTVALGIATKAPAPELIGLMTPPWKLEERVKGLLDPNRRLTTTMNIRHLALMAITLATGTTLIAGSRIVAAPNPKVQQDTVELTTHVNPKTKKVTISAKTTRRDVVKVAKTVKFVTTPKLQKIQSLDLYSKNPTIINMSPQDAYAVKVTEDRSKLPYTVHVEKAKSTSNPTYSTTITSVDPFTSSSATTIVEAAKSTSTSASTSSIVADPFVQAAGTVAASRSDFKGDTKIDPQVLLKVKSGDSGDSRVEWVYPNQKVKSGDGNSFTYSITKDAASQDFRVKLAKPENMETETLLTPQFIIADGKGKVHTETFTYQLAKPELKTSKIYDVKVDPRNLKPQIYSFAPNLLAPKPTTVYIDGGKIKIVGDNVRVVYVNSHEKPGKAAKAASTGSNPKTKN